MQKRVPILRLKNVSKFYYSKGIIASGFNRISLDFDMGEFVVITGESGSGKSTLLNVLSGLDTYEEGEMFINGEETSHYNEIDFEKYRKTYIGNIFQTFNLVNSYTVYQNIEFVLLLNGYKKKDIHARVIKLIKDVDLYRFRNTRVSRLSGGQKQRVAIARALAKDTPIIIADEPTGNLDGKSAKSVIKLLAQIAKEKLVILVTHNYDQVKEYATRKIEMHDGKVREDIALKSYPIIEAKPANFDDITLVNNIELGIRNTFNIIPKFVLMFMVFLFVIVAFLGEYSSFQKLEYEESLLGYNSFFSNTDDKRIIIKKADGSYISERDLNELQYLNFVNSVDSNDILLDYSFFNMQNDYFYFGGNFYSIDDLDHVDIGRMPEATNEVVIMGSKYDYSISEEPGIFDAELEVTNNINFPLTNEKMKVVGVVFKDTYDFTNKFYVTESCFEEISMRIYDYYSNITILINDHTIKVNNWDSYFYPIPSKIVKKGEVIVSSNINHLCSNNNCFNNVLTIKSDMLYYQSTLDLKITNVYDNKNYVAIFNHSKPEYIDGEIYISFDDYNKLFNQNVYQSSIFVDKAANVDTVANSLQEKGYKTYLMRDLKVQDAQEIMAVIRVYKMIVTIVLFIALFFIAYFVIRLIQKSKNTYYSTVRILGGSKKVINSLIRIELLSVFNLAFLTTIIFIIMIKNDLLHLKYIQTLCDYLELKDYLLIYGILFIMSIFIAMRYSRKLFKSSAMRTYNEEV